MTIIYSGQLHHKHQFVLSVTVLNIESIYMIPTVCDEMLFSFLFQKESENKTNQQDQEPTS